MPLGCVTACAELAKNKQTAEQRESCKRFRSVSSGHGLRHARVQSNELSLKGGRCPKLLNRLGQADVDLWSQTIRKKSAVT